MSSTYKALLPCYYQTVMSSTLHELTVFFQNNIEVRPECQTRLPHERRKLQNDLFGLLLLPNVSMTITLRWKFLCRVTILGPPHSSQDHILPISMVSCSLTNFQRPNKASVDPMPPLRVLRSNSFHPMVTSLCLPYCIWGQGGIHALFVYLHRLLKVILQN